MNSYLKILKFYLRKDRLKLIVWFIINILCSVGITMLIPDIFKDTNDFTIMVESLKNPALIMINGPIYGNAPYSLAFMDVIEIAMFISIIVACMNVGIVIKNTRYQEENELSELLVSLPIKKQALNIALILELLIVNIITMIVMFISYRLISLDGSTLLGDLCLAIIPMSVGFIFACLTLVIVQLFNTTSICNIVSYGLVGFFYFLRGVLDNTYPSLSYLSPLSWIFKAEIYYNDNFILIIFLIIITSLILIALALKLYQIRDINSSIIKIKEKEYKPSSLMKSCFGLVFRLERFNIIIWLIIISILGIAYGSFLPSIKDMVDGLSNGLMMDILGSSDNINMMMLNYLNMITMFSLALALVPLLGIINHLYKEERIQRIESIIALPIKRNKIYFSYIIIVLVLTIIFFIISFTSLYLSALPSLDSLLTFNDFFLASLNLLPSILLYLGIACFILGTFPKLLKLVYVYLGLDFALTYFNKIINYPRWLNKLFAFGYTNENPIKDFNYYTFIIIIIISFILIILGYIFYNKRDLNK